MPKIKVNHVAFYFDELLADLLLMTPEAGGAYVRLFCKIYSEGGSLLNNIESLASIAGFSPLDFNRVWAQIKSKFYVRNGRLYQKRCSLELKKARQFIQNQRKAGLASGKARQRRSSGVTNGVQAALQQRSNGEPTKEGNEYNIRKDLVVSDNTIAHKGTELLPPKIMNDLELLFKEITRSLKPIKKDTIMLADIAYHLASKYPDRLKDAVEWVHKARTKKTPIAYFIGIVKKETGWQISKDATRLGISLSAIKLGMIESK